MFKHLLLSSITGLIVVCFIAQHDTWMQHMVHRRVIAQLENALDCRISCRLREVSWRGRLSLQDMYVMPRCGTDWSWRAQRFEVSFSWLQMFLYGTFDFTINMHKLRAYSKIINNQLAMQDHLYLAFMGPQLNIYMFLKGMTLDDARICIQDPDKKAYADLHWDSRIKKIDNCFKATMDLYDGSCITDKRILYKQAAGSLQFDSFDGRQTFDLCCKGAASVEIPQLGSEVTPCYISGGWHHNRGTFSLKNVDHSFVIDPVIIQKDQDDVFASIEAKVPLNYVWHMLTEDNTDDRLSGHASVQAKLHKHAGELDTHGHIVAQRMHWQESEVASLAKITFNKQQQHMGGNLYLQRTSGACAGGHWSAGVNDNTLQAHMSNSARLTFSPKHDWQILPDDLHVDCFSDLHGYVRCQYTVQATHAKAQEQIRSEGTVTIDGARLQAKGTLDEHTFHVDASYDDALTLEQFTYADDQDHQLIHVAQEHEHYSGFVDFAALKQIMKKHVRYDLQGEGVFDLTAYKQDDAYRAHIALQNGAIRLPRTYNFMQAFDCDLCINPQAKTATLSDLICTLHNGKIHSKKMHITLTDDLSPRFVYAPLIFDHCLINVEKELFAVVSGTLFLNKKQDVGTVLQGQLILDRSQLKENIFSDVFQKNMRTLTAYSFETQDDDMRCDVQIKTKYPVRVQTPFLQTDARLNLSIGNTVRDPQVQGSIYLNTGQLHFPYKPLYISKGAIHFQPGKIDDPLIELQAKNTIKKNNINLHVTGSLQNQHVTLESSPTLTEEQIIALLLVGSHEESLNIVMPALIMQNIKSILFGYDQTTANMSRYFGNLFKPFRRIHLVPSFIDQSGRGGLRGAVEIDISDRWRAVIQKNFSLTEDTRFELEYLLSDDISIRGTRDIRRDLIGEVEMRYKFGD